MYRIGIDLGGTNIAVGIVGDDHRILAQISVPTLARRTPEAVIADMGDAVEAVLAQAGIAAGDCASIGIGSPGTCDSARGVVVRAYNLGWHEVPVCAMLTERFGLPARLSNDANCAALAEVVAGAARGCRNMVLITLGTGVGGGIILNGEIYAGMRSAGAELGHTLLVLDGEPCTCGRRGCWEAYASATALIRQTKQAAEAHPGSLLAAEAAQGITGRTAFRAAMEGDAAAQAVVDRYCEYVAAGLTDLVNALAPEMILLGGGISRQGEALLAPIREYVATHCFGQRQGAIPVIAAAQLGNEAGIIGAAAL
jgi:glucokinase-like ROK family protein